MFGIRLKELRTEHNLSQKELAKALGYNQSMISFWENGTNEPGETAIRKTALYFNVTADYLLGLEDETGAKTYQSGKYVIGTISDAKIDLH